MQRFVDVVRYTRITEKSPSSYVYCILILGMVSVKSRTQSIGNLVPFKRGSKVDILKFEHFVKR